MRHYQFDFSKVRLTEFLRICGASWPLALLIWPLVSFGLIWKSGRCTRPECREEWDQDLEDLPEPAQSQMANAIETLNTAGYLDPMVECRINSGPGGDKTMAAAARARHADGTHIVSIIYTCVFTVLGERESTSTVLGSYLPDERTAGTADYGRTFDLIPGVSARYHRGASLSDLQHHHAGHLEHLGITPIPLRCNDDVLRELEQFDERYFGHMVARGVMREVLEEPDDGTVLR